MAFGKEKNEFDIIIIGGGIAGLSAAIALRGPTRNIVVLEQSRLNREIGATISLQPNASKIIEQWGLAEPLAKTGALVDGGFRIYNIDGQLENTISLKGKTSYNAERIIYHRQDLHEALRKFAIDPEGQGPPADIRTSSVVTSCDVTEGTVHLEDGSTLTADLVIGADGIKSAMRKSIVGQDVNARLTGHSAYRLMVRTEDLEQHEPEFCKVINPRQSFTSMVMGFDRRLIMGPARNCELYSMVAMVPDAKAVVEGGNSWTSQADHEQVLRDFDAFPAWAKAPFKHSKDIGLWQLRDIPPLSTWVKGRGIIIGDAAHAMLPTQGQGASQAVEDAEALGAFFADVNGKPDAAEISERLTAIFKVRYERATLIQSYSRQSAAPATAKGEVKIQMSPVQFMDYNCNYNGARDWLDHHQSSQQVRA